MHKILYALLVSALFLGCDNSSGKKEKTQEKQVLTAPAAAISDEQIQTAKTYAETASNALKQADQLDNYNLISSLSRLAGSYTFRTFKKVNPDAKPGDIVLSQEANSKGPVLVQTLGLTLQQFDVKISKSTDTDLSDSLSLEFLDSQKIVEAAFKELNSQSNVSDEDMASILCIATAIAIEDNKETLDPTAAFGLAVMGFIEGTKTMPAVIE